MTLNDLQRILSKLEGIGQIRRSQMKAIVQKATKDKSRTITFDVSIFGENEINFNLIVIYFSNKDFTNFCNIFQKFPTFWEQLKGLSDHLSKEEDDILQAFNKLDSNGDGFVTKDELTLYLRNCGVLRNNNDDTAQKCFNRFDLNGDGRISYPEFVMAWKFNC